MEGHGHREVLFA